MAHRIDTPDRSVDLFGTGKHGYKEGGSPTQTDDEAFNAMQEELVAIVEDRGAPLTRLDNTQVARAIAAGVSNNWSVLAAPTAGSMNAIAWSLALEKFVAVGAAGATEASPDGRLWAVVTPVTIEDQNAIVYDPTLGLFVTVGDAGTSTRSSDAVGWSAVSVGTSDAQTDLATDGAGVLISVASGVQDVLRSVDGVDWLPVSVPLAALPNPPKRVTHDGARWLLMDASGNIATSEDGGLTWVSSATEIFGATPVALSLSSDGAGFLVATGEDGSNSLILTSTDGDKWTQRATWDALGVGRAVYSPDLGCWVTTISATTPSFFSWGGVSWTIGHNVKAVLGVITGMAFGNGAWVTSSTVAGAAFVSERATWKPEP